ncbi:MAG: nuclease-related domain-containing protein [Bacillota bacterium]
MIILERQIPERILALEAAIRRLSKNHEKLPDLHKELRSRKKGYKGELSFDYYLKLLPDDKYFILNQLRLPHKSTFFQIDSLLICELFILIIEIKSHSGKLHYDHSFRQLTRTYNEVVQGYPYPLSQVQRHSFQLKDWLRKNKFVDLPIEYLVVQSDPSSILSADTKSGIVYQ